ncbi:putative vacuolar protein sorting-associated protein vps17 [Phaeomoniella chlamydospora]|uniref:Vacuolar protein sorting-associated protein 17 n=1 Tax=Phaeomoniella chlamydospora TaxID=158046 RepID=A0A0G2GGB8_PHACM|nr:putative vacuolar protein sorting-associated protein vps17 [Phaeomoniella chlamydospora]
MRLKQAMSAQLGDPDYIGEAPPHVYQQYQAQQHQEQRHISPGQVRYQASQAARTPRTVPQYKLQAKITALERTGRKDPVLRFDVYTNLPRFRTTQFRDVRRTHGEFVKLAEHLISSNPEALVPAVPPALTSAGAGTDEDEARVKGGLQRWLNIVCSNDVLMRDDEMVFFVESDFGYSPVVRMKQPATGVRRKVLKQFAPPADDTPELHAARPAVKVFYLACLDSGHKLEKMVKARRALGLAENDLGVKLAQLHVQETHPGLSNAYRKLGRIIQTSGDYHAAQGTAEATTLGDQLAYYASDAFIVKETLTNRHILLREFLQAQQAARSKEAAANRLKVSTSVRREKVDEAIQQLDEALSHENYLKGKTARVTSNLLLEKRRWFQRTADSLKTSLREYVIRQIEAERRELATLESVRMDIRAIDSSGGLSRLGREAHPAVRRASLASSQGPKGDSWSGVPRRTDALNRSVSGASSLVSGIPEADEEEQDANGTTKEGRARSSTVGSAQNSALGAQDDDEDRLDAKNAASRLAQSTF